MRWRRGRAFNNSWGGSTDWLRLTAHSNIIDDLIERQEEEVYRSEEEREEEKWTCTHSSQWPSWGHWCKRTGFLGFYAHVFPLSFSLFHTRSTRTTSHFQFRGHLCFLSLLFLFFFFSSHSSWMILSPHTTVSSSTRTPSDTTASCYARPHLGTASLLKLKRQQQNLHSSFRRTWSKFQSTRKNLILCSAAAAAAATVAEETVSMSLKSEGEPNNNVSMEEEVSLSAEGKKSLKSGQKLS